MYKIYFDDPWSLSDYQKNQLSQCNDNESLSKVCFNITDNVKIFDNCMKFYTYNWYLMFTVYFV